MSEADGVKPTPCPECSGSGQIGPAVGCDECGGSGEADGVKPTERPAVEEIIGVLIAADNKHYGTSKTWDQITPSNRLNYDETANLILASPCIAKAVHCVNLHDELVEVLEGILKFEQQIGRGEFLAARDYDALFSRARALVARAKGAVLAKVKP